MYLCVRLCAVYARFDEIEQPKLAITPRAYFTAEKHRCLAKYTQPASSVYNVVVVVAVAAAFVDVAVVVLHRTKIYNMHVVYVYVSFHRVYTTFLIRLHEEHFFLFSSCCFLCTAQTLTFISIKKDVG